MERRPEDVRGAGPEPEPPPLWDAENATMEDDGPMFPGWFKVAAVLAALVAAVWGGWVAANTAGVCIPEWRRLTDEEVLDRTRTYAMYAREAFIGRLISDGDLRPSQNIARYEDTARFAADHPDCCEIVRLDTKTLRDEDREWYGWARRRGNLRAVVRIRVDAGPFTYDDVSMVRNCGRLSHNPW